jgi:chemotaxis protein MotB
MARRRTRSEANIWPGFVDGLSTLLLVLMFVLSIFVVAQFYLGERVQSFKEEIATKDEELARLIAQVDLLNDQLGLVQTERDQLQTQILALESTLAQKDEELLGLNAAIAASAAELEAEKALTEEQRSALATLNAQIAALRGQLASLQAALDAAEAKAVEQQAQIENLSTRLNAALAGAVLELQEVRSRFFEEMREALQGLEGVRVEGDRFLIGGDALFGSCETTISAAGAQALDKVAAAILEIDRRIKAQIAEREDDPDTQAIQDWVVRVDGHADATPLGPSCAARFIDNKGLSAARALSVTRYLESRGVPSRRLVASGLGSDFPVVAGYSPEALAQNRRIEFKLTER